jgi:hypothetical protein
MKKLTIVFVLSLLIAPSVNVQAADLQITQVKAIQDLVIDTPTLSRGYTLSTPTQQFFLGIFPDVLSQESRVVVKQYDNGLFDFPDGYEPVSDVYEFDIFNQKAFSNVKPLVVRFELEEPVTEAKKLFFYNGTISQWVALPSTSEGLSRVKANIHLPYAKIAVLKETVMAYGHASWYAYKDCDCAASPDYPKGSYVKVTNLDNGKSLIVRINDYGPDRSIFPERVIDLDKVAFAKLGNLRAGVLKNVKVEKIN